jgi:signal transduction histidine kinase
VTKDYYLTDEYQKVEVRHLRVLLADDDEDDYLITKDLLSSIFSYEVELDWAPNYAVALEAIERNEHDVYFVDYRFGEADGIDLVKQASARGCKAPIILLTGHDDWETDVRAMRAGAADYLVKGMLETRLMERSIRYALEHKRAQEELKAYAADIEHKNRELAEAVRVAREATELKSQFLANVSHEIRTPMHGVLGMTGLLLDSELSEEQRDYARSAFTSAESLLAVIDGVLDLSKIEAGKLELVSVDFEPARVVEDVAKLLSIRARTKGLELYFTVCPDARTLLRGDATRLRQVLMNLTGNAIKFTERGHVSVDVRLVKCSGRNLTFLFEVQDSGIGIGEENKHRLFTPFVQENGSTTRRYGGTGLGLAISKQLVEMMGGAIGFESERGKGSRFWFTAQLDACAIPPLLRHENSAPSHEVFEPQHR